MCVFFLFNSCVARIHTRFERCAAWVIKITSYWEPVKPAIKYALQLTRFAPSQCHHELQKPVVNSLLPKMGFNRKMPRAVVFGPRALGGSEFIHLETEQFSLQLTYYVRCLTRKGLQHRENIYLTAAYQRFLGLTKQFFQTDPNTICYKPRNSKMTFLWTEIWKHDLRNQNLKTTKA